MNRVERNKKRARRRKRKAKRRALQRARDAAAFWEVRHQQTARMLATAQADSARVRAHLRQAAVDLAYAYAAVELAEHRAACAERETQDMVNIVAAMRRQGAGRIQA